MGNNKDVKDISFKDFCFRINKVYAPLMWEITNTNTEKKGICYEEYLPLMFSVDLEHDDESLTWEGKTIIMSDSFDDWPIASCKEAIAELDNFIASAQALRIALQICTDEIKEDVQP